MQSYGRIPRAVVQSKYGNWQVRAQPLIHGQLDAVIARMHYKHKAGVDALSVFTNFDREICCRLLRHSCNAIICLYIYDAILGKPPDKVSFDTSRTEISN